MSNSPLDFISSDGFRKKLVTRNLVPYAKSPNRPSVQTNYEYIQSDTSVQDSPDQLIDTPSFANQLYPLNQYGNEGGYEQVPDTGALLNTKSNEGEYGYQDANIVDQSLLESQKWKPLNVFSNGNQLPLDSAPFFESLDRPQTTNTSNNQPYPTTFVPSVYSPLSILLSSNPGGSNGLMSQDSFIVRLGAQTLRRDFEQRIASQIRRQTIGRANILNVTSGTDLVNIISGQVPILEPNWQITVPANPIIAAADFALRLGGSILPVSIIPGSYFDVTINPGQPTTIQQITNAFRGTGVGKFFNQLLGGAQTGSQIFYNNTGAGQRSRLFKNLDFNKFKPNYDRGVFDRIAGALTGTVSNNSNFYVGNITSNPSRVFSPGGDLPVDAFAREQQSPVYGPQELAQLYEGPSQDVRLGANGPTYSNGGGIEGGFTWVSPKYKGNAGKKVGIGGVVTNDDEDFRPSSYNSTESTNRQFREGSILDDTQRLIDSQPQGGRRLQHVGNAIDQVSKIFHDGYKEITKGSKVYRYVGEIGQEVGTEYCRIFAKDVPYLQYNDLQKADGITTSGRRFSDSVLDNTYNLNIAPNKQEGGQDSTNLIGGLNNGYAKKYMFSLENLAWRTSSTPGYSVSDLPVCERGPNGGRVMWFAPYGLTFTEQSTANWNQNDFLGRPEPIYTYKNSSRTGTLTWKVVVDHPSSLNVIVNKVLNNETNKARVDSILESFFAGCRKYDLYELAKKYYNVNPNDLFQLQEAISSKDVSKEQIEFIKKTVKVEPEVSQATINNNYFDRYKNLGFYFGNDFPERNTTINYTQEYNRYTSSSNLAFYNSKPNAEQTSVFFSSVVTPNYTLAQELATDLSKQLTQFTEGTVTLNLEASCSAPASESYNVELSKRRLDAIEKFFVDNPLTKPFIDSKRLLIIKERAAGENASVLKFNPEKKEFTPNTTVNCSDSSTNAVGGDISNGVGSKDIFTTNAMACRRGYIKTISSTLSAPPTTPKPEYKTILEGQTITKTVSEPVVVQEYRPKDNITKRILRVLLSECDYFETIKQETPMVFDNLKDKLKFFHPGFHSTTPEGLNSRLTFLQQCMRPGDTIPVIKGIGTSQTLQYNNATNTAFGAPPVLVLRIGDFYNTKIIPDNLSLTYESLDINPEGIGVQPMIANVTLSFKFVGGSGLKESIDKLQNSLTFNYYANTEIWDDRADSTSQESFLKVLDQEFIKMSTPPSPPAVNQAVPNSGQNNNSTIGNVITNIPSTTGDSGTISYSDFMVNVVNQTQTYFQTVINKTKESVNQYNNAVRQQWMLERSYTQGHIIVADSTSDVTELFGKPSSVEKRFDTIFKSLEDDIKDNDEGFVKWMSSPTFGFSNKVIRQVKDNYVTLVKNKRGVFQNGITKITQEIVNAEQSYIQTLGRVNTIVYKATSDEEGTDGYQAKSGPVKIYYTSGTTGVNLTSNGVTDTFVELVDDIKKINTGINEFNKVIFSPESFTYPADSKEYQGVLVLPTDTKGKSTYTTIEDVFVPFAKRNEFDDKSFRRVYMLVSGDIVDEKKYETFKTSMIGNIINNKGIIGSGFDDIEKRFDEYWIGVAKPLFVEENNITKSFIDNLEKTKLKNFVKYTPFDKKDRVFTFRTDGSPSEEKKKAQEKLIKGLGLTTNLNNENNKWNSEDGATGAFISKVKLN